METILDLLVPAPLSGIAAAGLVALSFVTSMLTAALGLGGGILMVATMASLVPPTSLIPLHGLIQFGSNGGRAVRFREHVRHRIVLWFVLGALIGVAVGAMVAVQLSRDALLILVGGFVLATTWMPALGRFQVPDRGFLAVGAITAFITMFAGATGPLLAPFLAPERLGDRHATIATIAACMWLKHGLKVAAFAIAGFAYGPWLPLAAVMIASGFLGTVFGKRVVARIPEARFRAVFKGLLTVLALRLIYQGALG